MVSAYQSPGVYVKEVPSGSAPIAGVGTSTAGFIGVFGAASAPASAVPTVTTRSIGSREQPTAVGTGTGRKKSFDLPQSEGAEVVTTAGTFGFFVGTTERQDVQLTLQDGKATLTFTGDAPDNKAEITGFFQLKETATPAPAATVATPVSSTLATANQVKLCTNFSEFKKFFGDFSDNAGQNLLAHGVFGFFRNGGTSCYVVWINQEGEIDKALEQFEAIDDIAIVAAPGITSRTVLTSIAAHCEGLGDRVAIFDAPLEVETNGSLDLGLLKPDNQQKVIPDNSDYAALYFPWIQVFDPASRQTIYAPPSGHIAGVYARVDAERGVFKAPANETVLGAVGLKYDISRSKQDKLNPHGINCIRSLNGNIRIWGARTLGGDGNTEFKYINIRRLFNYLRESIDEGTQWAVFEPNAPDLWAKIRRNINAFLLIAWQEGALFGNTPEQAFYVKCDEETNPPEIRDAGQVVTEIGVAVVKPAEFVIFKLSQSSGEQGS
ncbi:phage tail sheath subtilisin-like domain-containing protein [Leptolyngbya sp. FACHB-17]|uniref:phage tail sheath family protein n=1 Tax=unclassified Leptolyngbya TaxID=2650499 RepID=UPI0016804943|nr:phage tail sheath subtilisin-like domain-containing protein [Leptolyngbya sp. FACHB-17]MBD2080282.1 phage tail sheath family protein [Leptolyngbya sp. FACHB-17]